MSLHLGAISLAIIAATNPIASPADTGSPEVIPATSGKVVVNSSKDISLKNNGGVSEISAELHAQEAPNLGLQISMPPGSTLKSGEDNGAYALSRSGAFLFAAGDSRAITADGEEVEAAIQVTPNGISIKPVRDIGRAEYPLILKTTLGIDLIDRVEHGTDRGKPRWMIFPSGIGRATPAPVMITAGWDEARTRGKIPDTKSLYNQYACHPMSEVARAKSSWNIEAWRPDVGLARTIAAACNPGGGGD